jgi:hypothetical protein
MPITLIKQLHQSYLETKTITLPPELEPAPSGFRLIGWVHELYDYYREEGLIVRAFDVLPPLRLSAEEQNSVSIQNVHAFIINDLNMIPMKTRRAVIGETLAHADAATTWQAVAPELLATIKHLDVDDAQQELSWTASPISELLWALSWFFMEMETVEPPQAVRMAAARFPWYRWTTVDGSPSPWEPEVPLCRPQWLALDLLRRRMQA